MLINRAVILNYTLFDQILPQSLTIIMLYYPGLHYSQIKLMTMQHNL